MTDTESAFLLAICEQPDEDTPRLAFADWLSEQSGPVNLAWANGIRAQIWQARGDTGAATAQQSRVFDSPYGREKVRERLGIPQEIEAGDWERGFPATLQGDFADVARAWPRLANRVPCRALHFDWTEDGAISALVTWPGLSRLKRLGLLSWSSLGRNSETAVLALANCPALGNLESLGIGNAYITDSGAEAVLNSPYLTRLRALALRLRQTCPPLSLAVTNRLRTRFGPDVIT